MPRLLAASQDMPNAIVVGATRDPETGRGRTVAEHASTTTHSDSHGCPIADQLQRADTFNGNVVLIPWSARVAVGPIDGAFPHAYADDDYGLRATALGVPIVQAPGAVGTCPRNPAKPSDLGGLAAPVATPSVPGRPAVASSSAVPPQARGLALAIDPRWRSGPACRKKGS